MPHLTIEATANLKDLVQADVLLDRAHHALLESGVFDGVDVKSRLLWLDSFRVGLPAQGGGFVHGSLSLLSGRSESVRSSLAQGITAALNSALPAGLGFPVQVSCDVRDMNRDSYAKAVRI